MMPRFVLLRHECPACFGKPSHWDFMLEWGDALRTWDLRELPTGWAAVLGVPPSAASVKALPLADHRIEYLEFEGPLSGDRGSVLRCDRGSYEVRDDSPERLEVELKGEKFSGTLQLELVGSYWQLTEIAGSIP